MHACLSFLGTVKIIIYSKLMVIMGTKKENLGTCQNETKNEIRKTN